MSFPVREILYSLQVQGAFLDTAVWHEVSNLLKNPEKVERENQDLSRAGASLGATETLKSQRSKLEHVLERLIDSFTEGLIEKDHFTLRMGRAKSRMVELDAKIKVDAGEVDQQEQLRLATKRLHELAAAVGPPAG